MTVMKMLPVSTQLEAILVIVNSASTATEQRAPKVPALRIYAQTMKSVFHLQHWTANVKMDSSVTKIRHVSISMSVLPKLSVIKMLNASIHLVVTNASAPEAILAMVENVFRASVLISCVLRTKQGFERLIAHFRTRNQLTNPNLKSVLRQQP